MEKTKRKIKCPYCGEMNLYENDKCTCGYYFDRDEYDKKQANISEMTCEKCGKTDKTISHYQFYVGRHVKSEIDPGSGYKDTFSINTKPISVMICNTCILEKRLKSIILSIAFIIVFASVLIFSNVGEDTDGQGAIGFLILILFMFSWLIRSISRKKSSYGDSIAKNLNKKKYKSMGYDTLYTTNEYLNSKKKDT